MVVGVVGFAGVVGLIVAWLTGGGALTRQALNPTITPSATPRRPMMGVEGEAYGCRKVIFAFYLNPSFCLNNALRVCRFRPFAFPCARKARSEP